MEQGGSERRDSAGADAAADPAVSSSGLRVELTAWLREPPRAWPAVLFAVFGAAATAIYAASLRAPFVSDDFGYLVGHPYTAPLDLANLLAIFDPWGPAKLYAANYAPIHLLLTAIERHIFADALLGYHLVNVGIHAGVTTLLVALLRRAGVRPIPALIGAGFFLVHPANVEAVAWASQLKTNASLAFALGAWLAVERRPGLATGLFVASLLTKASGLFLLVAAPVWLWTRAADRRAAAWMGLWVVLAGLYAIPQFASFQHLGQVEVPAYADLSVHARSILAIALRYAVMAFSSFGVSAFQEPPPVASWLDAWWIGGALLCLGLGIRSVATFRARQVEASFWLAAAASFAPVSQLFPFLNPVADRYLYFILPGLIGGALLALGCARDPEHAPGSPGLRSAATLACCAVLVAFAAASADRARIWQSETLLLLDAARHYPEGGTAHFLRARSAAREGDVETAIAALRLASERGVDRFNALRRDPGLAPIRETPEFRALLAELAGRWIELARSRGIVTQSEFRMLALSHLQRDELPEAIEAFEQALAAEGPLDEVLRQELDEARRRGGGRGHRTP